MKIGFDLAQAATPLTGCGWYAHTLLRAMATAAPNREFLAYRHFSQWINDPANLAPLPVGTLVTDPLEGRTPAQIASAWQEALAVGQAPGRPGLVHSTSFQAPRLSQAKLVLTVFDFSFWAVPAYTTEQIRLACQKGVLDALARADGLIFISDHARNEFDKFLPAFPRKAQLLTTVTPLASRWPLRDQVPADAGQYWLFVGTLETLAKTWKISSRDTNSTFDPSPHPYRLWIAGASGWKNHAIRDRIEPLAARGLVRPLGYVADDHMQGLYREAKALLIPSWYEGFGLPALEAMSQGCPVICSDRTSLPEVAGTAACYIDPAQPATIAAAMDRLQWAPDYRLSLISAGLRQAGFSPGNKPPN